MLPQCIIRSANHLEEIKIVMQWAVEENWFVGKHDAVTYYATFPKGCQLLLHNENPVGALFLANYRHFTFIGLFILHKNYRGLGLGRMLWDDVMEQINPALGLGLFAVPERITIYECCGFSGQYEVQRWEARSSATFIDIQLESVQPLFNNSELLKRVEDYDKEVFPEPRFDLIKSMLNMDETVGFALQHAGKILGYGLMRPCEMTNVYRVMLYADYVENAKILTKVLLAAASGGVEKKIIFDIPISNPDLKIFAEYFHLEHIPSCNTYMMLKNAPQHPINPSCKTYSVCSLELG